MVAQRLAAADPTNAGWQRDLWVSYYKTANVCEDAGDAEAPRLWRMAHDILSGMKQRGLFISPQDERFLQLLRSKASP